jgi:hypothetical protein
MKQEHRQQLAQSAPKLEEDPEFGVCKTHETCQKVLKKVWPKKVRKVIEQSTGSLNTLWVDVDEVIFEGMSAGCKEKMVGVLSVVGKHIQKEISEAATREITNYHKTI